MAQDQESTRGIKKNTPQGNFNIPDGKNYLLIIGIDQYKNKVPPLMNAVKDALSFRDVLLNQYQFNSNNLIELYDDKATKGRILNAFDQLLERVTAKDNVIFYFSGHGMLHKHTQRGYWVPADAVLDDRSTYLSNSEVTDLIKVLKARHVFGVVDSCFSGALFRGSKKVPLARRLFAMPSRWLLTAGREELVLDGSLGDHSPFAKSLLNQLRYQQDFIGVSDLCNRVIEGVAYNTDKQTPRGEPLHGVGHDGGQFVFLKRGVNWENIREQLPHDQNPEEIVSGGLERNLVKGENSSMAPVETRSINTSNLSLAQLRELLQAFVRKNDYQKFFDTLRPMLQHRSSKVNMLTIQESAFNSNQNDRMMGMITEEQATITIRRISNALLYIIDRLEEEDLKR